MSECYFCCDTIREPRKKELNEIVDGPDNCNATHPGKSGKSSTSRWYCTRPAGHRGDHVACGIIDHKLFSWKRNPKEKA